MRAVAKSVFGARPPEIAQRSVMPESVLAVPLEGCAETAVTAVDSTVAETDDEVRPLGLLAEMALKDHVLEFAEMATKDHVLETSEMASKGRVLESLEMTPKDHVLESVDLVQCRWHDKRRRSGSRCRIYCGSQASWGC